MAEIDKGLYRDVFNLHAESLPRLGDPRFWDDFFWPCVDALAGKHRYNVFFIEMMLAVHGELEREQKDFKCPLCSIPEKSEALRAVNAGESGDFGGHKK